MFANWVQIAELVLLPVGLGIGFAAGRTCRQDERTSFDGELTITHPGLVQEYQYPTRDTFLVDRPAR
ncbi:hypothetical protein [Amycolatopsis sp. cmx-11-51]|uniref:hypothetical protein n=1 Tax=unclassified Amycolatopsis TaxID=2618356 RepID=UPI0039E417E8